MPTCNSVDENGNDTTRSYFALKVKDSELGKFNIKLRSHAADLPRFPNPGYSFAIIKDGKEMKFDNKDHPIERLSFDFDGEAENDYQRIEVSPLGETGKWHFKMVGPVCAEGFTDQWDMSLPGKWRLTNMYMEPEPKLEQPATEIQGSKPTAGRLESPAPQIIDGRPR